MATVMHQDGWHGTSCAKEQNAQGSKQEKGSKAS
jgi:hypothetical protein